MENVLPLGTAGHLLSAGTIPLSSVAVGLAVTGGFAFMLSEFLEQTLVVRRRR
jgi:multicomponent Na+:H+ antiporter subunit B